MDSPDADSGESHLSSVVPPHRLTAPVTVSSSDNECLSRSHTYSPASSRTRWLYGATSLMGNRSSNEDRCVAVPDLYADVSAFMEAMAKGSVDCAPFYGSDRGANWREASVLPRTCGQSSSSEDAFFAVYDGHSGQYASQYLHNVLHHSIYT